MYKVAVMGEYDSIYGFAAIGLDTFPVSEADKAKNILHRLAEEQYAVIFMTEKLAENLEHEIQMYKEKVVPAIILIPGVSGNTGAGVAGVKKTVEQAVGSDILFGDK
ncbi:MAG: V-type ATP synthase subunit F [Lachnospiraceae bacterium]